MYKLHSYSIIISFFYLFLFFHLGYSCISQSLWVEQLYVNVRCFHSRTPTNYRRATTFTQSSHPYIGPKPWLLFILNLTRGWGWPWFWTNLFRRLYYPPRHSYITLLQVLFLSYIEEILQALRLYHLLALSLKFSSDDMK